MSGFHKPKVKAPAPELLQKTQEVLDKTGVDTICHASACPNIAECFHRGTATFLILGPYCTRSCAFCNVPRGRGGFDPDEPMRVAQAVEGLGLSYVVVTSVDRDDLSDFGAGAFVATLRAVRERSGAKVELLTPDFQAKTPYLKQIIKAAPDKLAHNLETTERLYKRIKSAGSYAKSLKVLEYYARSGITTKSSLIVGLGESMEELYKAIADLKNVGVRQLTIGQYLRPSSANIPVQKYYSPEEFDDLRSYALAQGFEGVQSGPLVRSSYYAERM